MYVWYLYARIAQRRRLNFGKVYNMPNRKLKNYVRNRIIVIDDIGT